MALIAAHDPPPRVSVCIVNWNGGAMLADLLASLERVDDTATFEVIVVDNGSADGSAEMVGARGGAFRLIRHEENRGFARANNDAAAVARGEFLFFLNNDTVLPSGTLDRLVELLASRPDAAAAAPRLSNPDGTTQPSCRGHLTLAALCHRMVVLRWTGRFRKAHRAYLRAGDQPQEVEPVAAAAAAALMVRQSAFEACGGFDTRFRFGLEDADLCRALEPRGGVLYVPDVTVTHHGGIATRENFTYAYASFAVGYVAYLRKYGASPRALRWYRLAFILEQLARLVRVPPLLLMATLRGKASRKRSERLRLRAIVGFLRRDLLRFLRA